MRAIKLSKKGMEKAMKVLRFKVNGAGEFRDSLMVGGHALVRVRSRDGNRTIGFQCWGPCGGWRKEVEDNTNKAALLHLQEHGALSSGTNSEDAF